ncbi:MAG: aminotransferase class I/II-fold pyridoxal phosphate-dependent enzyme [Phycisphaeraceae bacterium]|nr:aminotransferase class I/II-fold pyridoxal phosphate-dependent enzyme [Phycisphaeraceae bacterium]
MSKTVKSDRLLALPPFLFDEIDRKKRERIAAGADVINLGVGDPDQPTPEFIVDEMNRAMRELVNQQYPAVGGGMRVFREAAAEFMQRRFGVTIDPMRHVIALLGSKDGIAHLPWAVTNPGDRVLVPDPAYPVYEIGATMAGCVVEKMPVSRESGWKPLLENGAPSDAAARLLWLNYPSNPTAASADVGFYERAIEWAAGHSDKARPMIVCSDLAYSELYMSDGRPPSLWQARNAGINDTPAIEFHSLSKTFNMTGWRLGFAVGHADVVGALNAVKSNVDSGTFNAIQQAGAAALRRFDGPEVAAMRRLYRERRDAAVAGFRAAGCEIESPDAGFFVWARTPHGMDSMQFAARLLEKADVVVVPGAGFSPRAREYFRVALTVDSHRLTEAAERMKRLTW